MNVTSVFISSYTCIKKGMRTNGSGPVVPFMDFFKNKNVRVSILEQPLPGSDDLHSFISHKSGDVFICGKQMPWTGAFLKKTESFTSNKTYFRLKIRDIVSNFFFLKNLHRKEGGTDVFIGLECVNALCGIILRKLGFVKKVIYYIFDWAPYRYKNPIVNSLYLFLDKIATYHADATWNITYAITEGRRDILHYDEKKMSPQVYVPYSPYFYDEYAAPVEDVDKNLLIYSGSLIYENGPDLLLKAFEYVLHGFPQAKLRIIGGGDIADELKEYTKRSGIEQSVEFAGYIADEKEVLRLQRNGLIAIAPYPKQKSSRKAFGDVIKIRMYFLSGLVTVSTPVPPVIKELKEEDLGFVSADDTPQELAKTIQEALSNVDRLFKMRQRVIHKARISSWDKTYERAFNKMGCNIN